MTVSKRTKTTKKTGSKKQVRVTKKKIKKKTRTKSTKKTNTTTKEMTSAAQTVPKTEKKAPVKVTKTVRSFKVKLPGSETYEGRFTGLTPYQAANKALSSYYRLKLTAKQRKTRIRFTIRESTRGSKKGEYTYHGKREKLTTPVSYPIEQPNGQVRIITKAFKNKLTKVKKAELAKILAEESS